MMKQRTLYERLATPKKYSRARTATPSTRIDSQLSMNTNNITNNNNCNNANKNYHQAQNYFNNVNSKEGI